MTDQDVRDFLERMATEEPVQFLDAEPLARRARHRAARTVVVGSVGIAAAIAVLFAGTVQLREASPRIPADPPEEHSVDLGIFEPVAGRMVYGADSKLWSVDANASLDPTLPSPRSTVERIDLGGTVDTDLYPLGWSSDGTKLLLLRPDPTDRDSADDRSLYVLRADGTETQVTPEPVESAAISPDGSRVAFATDGQGLYVVEAEGSQPVRIAREGASPTFSPDGTQIAYLSMPSPSGCCVQAGRTHVWVVNADGTNAHEILGDEPVLAGGASSLAWSPAGDRIAMEGSSNYQSTKAIYSFAPDGSEFTMVIPNGATPYWSPDGSQIAYHMLFPPGPFGSKVADADGSAHGSLLLWEDGDWGVGPWHPGAAAESAGPSPSPSPSTSPRPSPPPGFTRFTSTIHGISIDNPSGWQTRPATEPWTGEALSFDSPAADVIFDPALGDRLYLAIASQPYNGLSQDEWRDQAIDWLCTGKGSGGAFGSWTVDGADSFVLTCRSTASAALIFTDTRGYVIRLVASSDEPGLAATYDWDWHKEVLETVDLGPQEALDAPSPSASR